MTADPDLPVTPGRTPRFFFPDRLSPGASCMLPDQAAHHAMRVLRMRRGDTVVLFNGDGREWEATIADMRKSGVSVKIGAARARDVETPLPIALAQSISSRERMDLTLQKATELGVAQIFPLATKRSVVRLSDERAERRVAHWQHVVAAACEQCGRNRLPEIHPPEPFPDWLSRLPAQEGGLRLVLSPAAAQGLADLPPPPSVLLLVGPEGGLTPDEVDLALQFGFASVRLGPRILRTETAALAAISAMQALWGDF
jgi:16S rRNA (uracil1498-N3)-methyltransferase